MSSSSSDNGFQLVAIRSISTEGWRKSAPLSSRFTGIATPSVDGSIVNPSMLVRSETSRNTS